MYSLSQIANITDGRLQSIATPVVKYVSVDSRKIFFPAETLFFAIVTGQRDGHAFINELYEQGVRSFAVSKMPDKSHFPEAGFIAVPNTLLALQHLSASHRSQFHIPVIGITGSNGKTIVKEWLNLLLAADYNIVRSPKSYNSQIGVPLSVWQMNEAHTLAIFEAGISKPGEMDALQDIIRPTIGILTNIGAAHDEGFEDQQEKIHEKLKLFAQVKTLICSYDDLLVKEAVEKLPVEAFTWGKNKDCDLQIISVEKQGNQTTIHLITKDPQSPIPNSQSLFTIPFTDAASIENCLHCIAVCRYLKLPDDLIRERLQLLHPVEMRLEWKKAINNSYLINDSYSNDLSSLIIALDYLQQQRQTEKETVILSDIFQSGIADSMLYFQVADLLAQRKVERVIGIGTSISKYRQAFINQNITTEVFTNTDDFIRHFDTLQFKDEAILLKGARTFGFEKIARLLEQQDHQTVLEINLTALSNNLKKYRSLLRPSTKMMVMVKAFGYGSGGAEVAKVLQFNKVDYLAVAYADEGVALRLAGIHLPIMVMNAEPSTFDALDEYNLEPEIYSFDILESFLSYCKIQGISSFPVHLKLDTGMHRLGFEVSEAEELGMLLTKQHILRVRSVFTHLVASESAEHNGFTLQQAAQFIMACNSVERLLGYTFIRHAANTAAISRHPDLQMDMVRLGIGLYGVDSANDMDLDVVSTLKSTVAQIKNVKAGETVGYNRRGVVTKDSVIATIRIGYADGYRREMGNGKGFMRIKEQLAPVIGNVCMDMTMVDITGVDNVKPGDEVEVFGKNILIQELARQCNTIPYEMMTGVSQRVKRVYYEE
ncbi:MAG: bifunctional UDP-N-acetylmuramoyl-tripeptide:D-alanyl-D-alanine ligase/alanine racemase [Bacteroidota bacterium]